MIAPLTSIIHRFDLKSLLNKLSEQNFSEDDSLSFCANECMVDGTIVDWLDLPSFSLNDTARWIDDIGGSSRSIEKNTRSGSWNRYMQEYDDPSDYFSFSAVFIGFIREELPGGARCVAVSASFHGDIYESMDDEDSVSVNWEAKKDLSTEIGFGKLCLSATYDEFIQNAHSMWDGSTLVAEMEKIIDLRSVMGGFVPALHQRDELCKAVSSSKRRARRSGKTSAIAPVPEKKSKRL